MEQGLLWARGRACEVVYVYCSMCICVDKVTKENKQCVFGYLSRCVKTKRGGKIRQDQTYRYDWVNFTVTLQGEPVYSLADFRKSVTDLLNSLEMRAGSNWCYFVIGLISSVLGNHTLWR